MSFFIYKYSIILFMNLLIVFFFVWKGISLFQFTVAALKELKKKNQNVKDTAGYCRRVLLVF